GFLRIERQQWWVVGGDRYLVSQQKHSGKLDLMPLFDAGINRRENRPKREAEPLFTYYNTTGRPAFATIRNVLEEWFNRYPAADQQRLAGQFRSTIDSQHQSAFFELFLYELLLRLG